MTHKEIKSNIHNKLELALVDFKSLLGEKKYHNRIKKATKLIAEGLGKGIQKSEAPKASKTAIKKKVIPVVKKAAKAITKKAVKPITKKTVAIKKKVVTKAK